jgi:hypothetical protein
MRDRIILRLAHDIDGPIKGTLAALKEKLEGLVVLAALRIILARFRKVASSLVVLCDAHTFLGGELEKGMAFAEQTEEK